MDATPAALEAAIAAAPEAREGYAVYGDWLQQRGDPRGELIAIGGELAKSPDHKALLARRDELLAAHAPAILGPLADCSDVVTELDWYMGFVRGCRVAYTSERFNAPRGARRKPGDLADVAIPDVVRWLLDEPGPGRFLQHLTVGLVRHDDNTYEAVCAAIARKPRPTLRKLVLGDFEQEDCELNWAQIGPLAALWPAVPGLRKLVLRAGSMELAGIALPALEELTTITGGLDAASARAVATADWPSLVKLSLQYGPDSSATLDDITPLLGGDRTPRLRHLGLTNCELTDELCELLADSKLLPQLASLDLCMGTMSERGAEAIAKHRAAFSHLAVLNVEDNYLPYAVRATLDRIAGKLVFGEQRELVDADDTRQASAYE